ncbi:hypothetical protein, partial [Streptomyces albidoflavus]|uniref:hypothetical protein n=1 Tax=Streptomyces albidoflavus TaxID=1886 RepID=UPI00117E7340
MTSTADHTQQTEEAEQTREGEGAAPPPGPDAGFGAWDDGLIARRAAGAHTHLPRVAMCLVVSTAVALSAATV